MPCRSRCEVRVKAAHNTLLTREIMHFRDEVLAGSAVALHTMARCSADLDAKSFRLRSHAFHAPIAGTPEPAESFLRWVTCRMLDMQADNLLPRYS